MKILYVESSCVKEREKRHVVYPILIYQSTMLFGNE